jgi:hypothetical protein
MLLDRLENVVVCDFFAHQLLDKQEDQLCML